MDEFFIKHMSDLSRKSDINNKFTFSNFLNEAEINELLAKKSAFVPFTLFGGCKLTESLFFDSELFAFNFVDSSGELNSYLKTIEN